MARMVPRRRSRAEVDDESEDGSEHGGYDDETPSVGNSSKRARLGGDGAVGEVSPAVLPSSYLASSIPNGNGTAPSATTSGSGALKHQPGSIVRVTLKNFVTYTAAEFLPGPSLNMVIGPNGTGKSTLVCAICLGLGFKADALGRAKDVSEFIKHGAREAEIEIELAADPRRHKSNPVIKRQMKHKDNKTLWFIDGRPSTHKAVMQLNRSFSIQVDNLCQFLPQDKVVEFAALTPVELLSQTQRAAAPEYMVEWHEQLKALRREQREAQQDHKARTDELKNLESRQNLQRGDVDRLRERQEIQERIAAMERLRPFPLYKQALDRYNEAKTNKRTAQRALAELQQECEPALEAVNDKHTYVTSMAAVVEQKRRVRDRAEKNAELQFKKQDELQQSIEQCKAEILGEKDAFKEQKKSLKRHEAEIRDLNHKIEVSSMPEFDAAAHNERKRDIQRRKNEKQQLFDDANAQLTQANNEIESRRQQIEHTNSRIANLRSKAGQQAHKLNSVAPDTAKAWNWLQANTGTFSGKVFGPPIVTCTVKDPKYAKAIENSLGLNEMLSITFTSVQDYNKAQRHLIDQMHLREVYLRTIDRDLSFWKPPIPREQMSRLGLDAWALDLIEGPPEVLSMLCDNRNIHQAGVAYKDVSNEQYEALANSAVTAWVTPNELFQITRRREYGSQGVSARTQRLKDARIFTNQPVDSREEEQLKERLLELNGEMEEFKQQAKDRSAECSVYEDAIKELQKQIHDLDSEKDAVQKVRAQIAKLPLQRDKAQEKLNDVNNSIDSYKARVQEIQTRREKFTLEKAQEALNLAHAIKSLQPLHTSLLECSLLHLEAQSDLSTLESHNLEVRQQLQARQTELATLTTQSTQLKALAQQNLAQVNEIIPTMTPMETQIYHDLDTHAYSPEAFDREIEAVYARLEMAHGGGDGADARVIEQYEVRGRKIEELRGKIARIEEELAGCAERIAEVRARWEPLLDQLVAKISEAFSENFAQIQCAGQVEVYKDEEFENWAVQIQVRFRENEQMSILDSHRQSGGERAVSTIFYLMALQSLARAPFRVVDEINQGMDPRNERMVHSRMVSIACDTNTSQYFLITPKLLPNLTYHPNMKVHCIASGEYMPADHRVLDFQALATRALRLRGVV